MSNKKLADEGQKKPKSAWRRDGANARGLGREEPAPNGSQGLELVVLLAPAGSQLPLNRCPSPAHPLLERCGEVLAHATGHLSA
jgi:hypothetical protein